MGSRLSPRCRDKLVAEFGRGFTEKNPRRMMQFAEAFPDEAIRS